jgi:DNA-binding response OmpR family regulator
VGHQANTPNPHKVEELKRLSWKFLLLVQGVRGLGTIKGNPAMTKPIALIIEDDPQLNQIFTLALSSQFECEAIQDGQAALTRLTDVLPDVIVLDLHLPGVNGEVILNYICNEARLENARIILATADARQAEQLEDKADIVLLKPISPVQLRELAVRLHASVK